MYTVQKVQEDIFMVYLHSGVFFTTYLQFFIPTFPSIYLSCYNLREIGITVGGINQCKSFVFTRKMVDKLLRKMTLRQKNKLDIIAVHLYIISRHMLTKYVLANLQISILEVGFNHLILLLFHSHALMFKDRNIFPVLKMLHQDFRNGFVYYGFNYHFLLFVVILENVCYSLYRCTNGIYHKITIVLLPRNILFPLH